MALGYFIFHINEADSEKTHKTHNLSSRPSRIHTKEKPVEKSDEFRLASYNKGRVFLMKYSVPAWLYGGKNEIRV